jgi:pSer/pThr/pTyr-binding forkhead associated (FHA) protein
MGPEFATQFSGHWLVWEPGRWNAAPAQYDLTRRPKDQAEAAAIERDTLSFHLSARVPLRIGRAHLCDIVINDATVSREHMVLAPSGTMGWKLKVLSSGSTTAIGGIPCAPESETELTSGAVIRVGDVNLTFCDAQGLERRLLNNRL